MVAWKIGVRQNKKKSLVIEKKFRLEIVGNVHYEVLVPHYFTVFTWLKNLINLN